MLTRQDLSSTCKQVSLRVLEQRKKILSPHEESKLKNFKKIRTSDSALSTESHPLKNVAQENASKLEREREHAYLQAGENEKRHYGLQNREKMRRPS